MMECMQGDRVSCQGESALHSSSSGFGYGFSTVQNPVWTVSQVLLATDGRFISGSSHAQFRAISTDTRTIEAGDLFVALRGDNFNGEAFVNEAVKKGAAGVVVSMVPEQSLPVAVILVKNTLAALGDLAKYRRASMQHVQVLAITGSSGKTTVKEMTAVILGGKYEVLKTKGNFNNLIGMPLSLLPLGFRDDCAVLEMGMNRPGEIRRLTKIADPDIACIVNIQPAHLEGLGDISGVAQAKGELFEEMKLWGTLAVNIDDTRVRRLASKAGHAKITFGRRKEAFVRATHLYNKGEHGMAYTLHVGGKKKRLTLKALGAHNVENSLAAAALAYAAGMNIKEIVRGLESFEPPARRFEIERLQSGICVINDAYNANPSSVLAALKTLAGMSRSKRCVVALGDMLELGSVSEEAHKKTGEAVAEMGFTRLVTVGEYAKKTVEGARLKGMKASRTAFFESKKEMAPYLIQLVKEGVISTGDFVLIKGSRGMRMETLIEDMKRAGL